MALNIIHIVTCRRCDNKYVWHFLQESSLYLVKLYSLTDLISLIAVFSELSVYENIFAII